MACLVRGGGLEWAQTMKERFQKKKNGRARARKQRDEDTKREDNGKEMKNKYMKGSAQECSFVAAPFLRKTLVVDMDVHDDHANRGAARRRRERRLRAFLRHEKLSLAMQMAVSHHSWHRGGRADASTQIVTHSDAATCAATAAPAPEFEYVAPAPVIEYIAPAPTVILPVPSQQLSPVLSAATVATDVNLDITGPVSPQLCSTAVEASVPQVVGSLPPFEEFTEPVHNQVHQEQIVTGEMTQNIVENPAMQDQVIVQDIPEVVERIQERILDPVEVLPHERVQQFNAEHIVHMPVPQTQEPPVFVTAPMIEAAPVVSEDVQSAHVVECVTLA